MAKLRVHTIPDDAAVLRQKSKPMTDEAIRDPYFNELVGDLVKTMFESDGVGIAAPQVGILSRVIICCETAKQGDEVVFVNPEITERSGSELGAEGCLSVPGVTGDVERATQVTVKAQDSSGKPFTFEAKDLMARILQHEIDHLDGILFIDRVDSSQKSSSDSSSTPRL